MLKNPSRGPYITDGESTVQSSPLVSTSSIACRLRARVVERGIVDDAHRAEVDEAPDARVGRRPEQEPRPLRVDEAEARAAVPVAREGDEVEDRIRPVEGRGQGLGPGDVADRAC